MEFARTSPKKLKLILTARRIDTLKQIAEDINKEVGSGVHVLPVKLDVSKPEEVKGFIHSLPIDFQNIDVLVNNACVCAWLRLMCRILLTKATAVDLLKARQKRQIYLMKI